ncbi:MAG: 4-alpha-glucanotransferase [Propionibacteriaceae bacterium]|nr:4-alpha-glucanotransferase [Propionibacteriaceae bacterium]
MVEVDPKLRSVAEAYGVATQYVDSQGITRYPAGETITACLKALGVDTDSAHGIDRASAAAQDRAWTQPLPPCVVVSQGQDRLVDVHVASGRPANVMVCEEGGTCHILQQVDNWEEDRLVGGAMVGRASFQLLVDLPTGYHQLILESDGTTWSTDLVVTPSTVNLSMLPDSVWGFMVQLYSLCSGDSWGFGDFHDLGQLATIAKHQWNTDFLLINPIHAGHVTIPMNPSPYYPSTRRYIDPLYIRPEDTEEYIQGFKKAHKVVDQVGQLRQQSLSEALTCPEICRDSVWAAKRQALEMIFNELVSSGASSQKRLEEFEQYVRHEGEGLVRYATWCVLTEEYSVDVNSWPEQLRDPNSVEVLSFASHHQERIRFHQWLQFIAQEQASYAASRARHEAGMAVGIISDLAVGVSHSSEEVWANPSLFAEGVTVGAPPDAYNQAGQNWSQPPWRPDRLVEQSYEPLKQMMRTIFSFSPAVRIDHILGLFRLWWIPEGMSPDQGTYVHFDHEAMVGIVALEAERSGGVVIGEDLGTLDSWVRDYLSDHGILGTSVMWFEQGEDGPLAPELWRTLCLASVTTHDLPPTLGYLEQSHVYLRSELGLLSRTLDEELLSDVHEQQHMVHFLQSHGFLAIDELEPQMTMEGLYRYLASTPAMLKCVALTDAVGEKRTQNQPGSVDEYPNWRVPLGDRFGQRILVEDIPQVELVTRIAGIMNGTV